MLTTPLLGLPYAEPEDPTREYPDTVDAPRTLALDAHINAITAVISVTFAAASYPAGWATMATPTVTYHHGGPFIVNANGQIGVPFAGIYVASGTIAQNATVAQDIRIASGAGDAWPGVYVSPYGGRTAVTAMVSLPAGQTIHLAGYFAAPVGTLAGLATRLDIQCIRKL